MSGQRDWTIGDMLVWVEHLFYELFFFGGGGRGACVPAFQHLSVLEVGHQREPRRGRPSLWLPTRRHQRDGQHCLTRLHAISLVLASDRSDHADCGTMTAPKRCSTLTRLRAISLAAGSTGLVVSSQLQLYAVTHTFARTEG